MLKFAAFEVTSAVLAAPGMSRTASLTMQAHRAVFDYEPRPGFLYVRSRAISSRCNDNFDEFPAEEIEKAYRTFIGKPVFVNHHNENHRRARGVIIDAALHKDANADGTPDTWAEVLMEVDAVRFPILAKAILAGHIDRTSMGTDVAYSICSACGNKASSPAEYCSHIPRLKGKRIFQVNASTGRKEGVLIRETCYGLKFFENSLLVEEPADPTAFFLGVDDRGLKANASLVTEGSVADPFAEAKEQQVQNLLGISVKEVKEARKKHLPKSEKCHYCTSPAISRLLWAEGMAYIPHCADHRSDAVADAGGTNEVSGEQAIPAASDSSTTASFTGLSFEAFVTGERLEFSPEEQEFHRQMRDAGEMRAQMSEYSRQRPVNLADPADLKSHMIEAHGWTDDDFWRNSHDQDHPRMMEGSNDDRPLTHAEVRGAHDHEHEVEYPEDYPHTTLGDSHFHHASRTSALSFEAFVTEGKERQFTPEERATRRQQGQAWNRKNPVKIKNVVDHWNQATDDEKANGMSWYEDAHHLAKHVANDTDTPMHTMAGLMTNYSPQTHWAHNIMNAAKVARTKVALGGKGDGIMATSHQKAAAARMLDGEHYQDVFKSGAPKVRAFGHLIEHGDAGADGHVVIDRHALSVAAGARATDVAYEQSGLGGKKRYDQVANVYRKAAKVISKQEGKEVLPHHVQAATWMVRQRLNEQHDRDLSKTAGSRSATIARRAVNEWNSYAAEHHPGALGMAPGTGYSSSLPDDVKHSQQMAEEGKTVTKAGAWTPSQEDLADFTDMLSARVAFGETKAPADVDTLRDEECPVCGERDSYDGNKCQVCGFDAPPPMFQDPDLEMARNLDLRKDIMGDAGTLPGAAQDGMTPGEQDANGGLPAEVPGEEVPGSDQVPVPVDPSMVNPDGSVTPTTDPAQIAQQQMEMLQSGQPITPDMLGPNGEVTVDPSAATGHVDQGGEPFTPGPNAPMPEQPMEPGEQTVAPEDLDENGEPVNEDGQASAPPAGDGDPGTPADGVPDLQCPACGFQSDAEQPQSVDMDSQALPDAGTGSKAGDVCPNCGQAQMMSVGEMEQMAGAPARA